MTRSLFEAGIVSVLAADMQAHAVSCLEIDFPGGAKFRLCRPSSNVVKPTGSAAEAPAPSLHMVKSKAVGRLVLKDPATGQTLVQPGQRIDETTILGFVQVDILLRPIAASCAGLVEALLSSDGSGVDYGTPIFSLIADR